MTPRQSMTAQERIDLLTEAQRERINQIIDNACREFKVAVKDIRRKGRDTRTSNARKLACNALHAATSLGWSDIGHLLNLDHSTVMHHVNKNVLPWMPAVVKKITANLVEPNWPLLLRDLAEALGCSVPPHQLAPNGLGGFHITPVPSVPDKRG